MPTPWVTSVRFTEEERGEAGRSQSCLSALAHSVPCAWKAASGLSELSQLSGPRPYCAALGAFPDLLGPPWYSLARCLAFISVCNLAKARKTVLKIQNTASS